MNRWTPGDFEMANWQFWLLLFLIPSTIAAVARYLSFRLRYEGTELVIRSGLIFRNERHVPYARIQNLDAVRNLAHRLLGVAEVRVETGGGQAPEATISVLHETVFEEMRRRIFEGRARGQAGAQQPETPEAAVPAGRIANAAAPAAARGAAQRRCSTTAACCWWARPTACCGRRGCFAASGIRLARGAYGPGLVRDTAQTIAAGGVPSLTRIAVLLVGVVGFLVLVRLLSMIWSGVRLHDFRLSRVGDDLRTEYGLLHPRHGHDSAAPRADADDSGIAAAAPGQADVGAGRNRRRNRDAGGRAEAAARVAGADRPRGTRCPPSCAKSCPGSTWTRSNGSRCTRGRSAAP